MPEPFFRQQKDTQKTGVFLLACPFYGVVCGVGRAVYFHCMCVRCTGGYPLYAFPVGQQTSQSYVL